MNRFDFDIVITFVLFLAGALFVCAAAILIYALIIALEFRRRIKVLKENPKVIREWVPGNGRDPK